MKLLSCKYIQWFFDRLFVLLLKLRGIGTGSSLDRSGEEFVLAHLKFKGKRPVVLDVGANVGNYSLAVLKQWPDADVWAFEPVQATYNKLKERFSGKSYKLAFSDKEGTQTIYYNESSSGLASLYDRDLSHMGDALRQSEVVETVTLDNFVKKHDITHVDLLKIDAEGHELSVLKRGGSFIGNGHVDYIQFETGGANIDSRTYFRDFWKLLHEKYTIYRILPGGLRRVNFYVEWHEQFMTTNYLAERKR